MNRAGIILSCLTGVLVFTAGVRADDVVLPGDPYVTVVARNVFGLNPPPPPGPAIPDDPPPKITPNGIMDILGDLQVLFKVAVPAKPGGGAADQSYILSKGQRQDDIEVLNIDQRNSVVTFNNHGTTQTLPLVVTLPSSTAAPAAPGAPGGGGPGGRFAPGTVNPGIGPDGRRHGAAGGVSVGGGVNPASASGAGITGTSNDGSNLRAVPTRNGSFIDSASQIPEGITPETQPVLIEINRKLTEKQVQNGELPPLPNTELTPDPGGPQ